MRRDARTLDPRSAQRLTAQKRTVDSLVAKLAKERRQLRILVAEVYEFSTGQAIGDALGISKQRVNDLLNDFYAEADGEESA